MIKAKALALCICPAVAAPPAIIAVHAPARHAVAHLLHRAANRLDHGAVSHAAAPPAFAALPCAPSLASGGGGLPVVGGLGGGDLGEVLADSGETGAGAPFLGSAGGGLALGGGAPGGIGGVPGAPGAGPGPTSGTGPAGPGTPGMPGQVSGAPEPAAWALLVVGFGLVGVIARRGRPATVAA